jgi:hypothetical protein
MAVFAVDPYLELLGLNIALPNYRSVDLPVVKIIL